MEIFRTLTEIPDWIPRSLPELQWFTWSDEARTVLHDLNQAIDLLPEPGFVHLLSGADYDYTYTLEPPSRLPESLRDSMKELASALQRVTPPGGRMMLINLLDGQITGQLVHRFLAIIRYNIVRSAGDEFASLYTPLGDSGEEAGEFRLHADLYIPEMLLNIFDDVPNDGSGASTFLRVERFLDIVHDCKLVPEAVRSRLVSLFSDSIVEDRYEEYMHLVHDQANKWCQPLWRAMTREQEAISLHFGQGYLIHDRMWLHGRTAPRGGVPQWRSHRLTFHSQSNERQPPRD
jgi:hypothetical protein